MSVVGNKAWAQVGVSLRTSADFHDQKFFGSSLVGIIIDDANTNDDETVPDTTIQPTITVRDVAGEILTQTNFEAPDTRDGAQQFEFFLRSEGSTITPLDPVGFLSPTYDVGGDGAEIDIGGALSRGYTIEISYLDASTTITYDDTISTISKNKSSFGEDNTVCLDINDQDGNVDPTKPDIIIGNGFDNDENGLRDGWIDMTGVLGFDDNIVFTEIGENTAHFVGAYTISETPGDDVIQIDPTVAIPSISLNIHDDSKYVDDTDGDGDIDLEDSDVSGNPENFAVSTDVYPFTVENSDGQLQDVGSLTMSSELFLTLSDNDRDVDCREFDVIPAVFPNVDFRNFNPDDISNAGNSGVIIYVDAPGGDKETADMVERSESTGTFDLDFPIFREITFLASGESASRNGIIEFTSADIDKNIIISYIDPAPRSEDGRVVSFSVPLSRTPGTVELPERVDVNTDFVPTFIEPDLDDTRPGRPFDIYQLVLQGTGTADTNGDGIVDTADRSEFGLTRDGISLADQSTDALYASFELKLNGKNMDFSTPLGYQFVSLSGTFLPTLSMSELIASSGESVHDGDTLEVIYHDYMQVPATLSSDVMVIGSPNAEPSIDDLIDLIDGMDLSKNTHKSLMALAKGASQILDDDNPHNDSAACGKLGAFIHQLKAKEKNGKLSTEQADQLLEMAGSIQKQIGCDT
jgi:hypothetical protein